MLRVFNICFVRFVCSVVSFFFCLRLCSPSFWIPSLAGAPGGQGSLGTAAIYCSCYEPFGKNWGYKISAKRLYRKRLQEVLLGTTAYCYWGKLGIGLRTVFDNVQEQESSVKTDRGGVGVYASILIGGRLGFLGRWQLGILKCATDSHRNLRPLVTR